jgi:hypothetical protein
MRFIDLAGRRFGYLTATAYDRTIYKWVCRCACGNVRHLTSNALTTGDITSCGCQKGKTIAAQKLRHGHTKRSGSSRLISPEYLTWCNMRRRCYDPKTAHYRLYGGRGIGVCDSWRESFEAFYKDMGPRPTPGHSIERLDNDLGYEPDNCVWATAAQQISNRRPFGNLVTFNGITSTLSGHARRHGLRPDLVKGRVKTQGWNLERALTTPAGPNGRKKSS